MKNSFLRPSRSVSQPKNTRAEHGPGDVGAAGQADIGVAELQDRALLQGARHGARQRHLEPIEDPGDPERHDDEGVEPTPRQTVQPRGDVRLQHRIGRDRGRSRWLFQ